MIVQFNHFEFAMTKEQALSASHPGRCDEDVLVLLKDKYISRQLDKIGSKKIREELRDYGAWDKDELENEQDNRARIVWLAAGSIKDELK